MDEKEFLGLRFRSKYSYARYGVTDSLEGKNSNGQYWRKQGKELVFNGVGLLDPISDVECLEFLCQPHIQREVVALWPGLDNPGLMPGMARGFDTQMTDWEYGQMEKLIDRIKNKDKVEEAEDKTLSPIQKMKKQANRTAAVAR